MRTNRRRMMCHVVDMNVEYIMTNGNQFILTDWIPLIDTKFEMYFHVKDVLHKNDLNNTFILSTGENYTIFTFNNGFKGYEYNIVYLWNDKKFGFGGKINSINIDDYINTQTPLLLYMSKDSVGYYTGNVFTKKPLSLRTQPCTTPLMLFTEVLEGSYHCYNRAKLYIYGIRCWNNGLLERDFVPAKKDGIYGLYEKVNKKFWRSNSGVDFLGKDK